MSLDVLGTGVVAAPLTLQRVGGLPADVLDIVSDRLRSVLLEHRKAVLGLDDLALRLGDALYAVIPRFEDKRLRRQVLRIRRLVHQRSGLQWEPGIRDALDQELEPGQRADLDRWDVLSNQAARAAAELGPLVENDHRLVVEQLAYAFEAAGYAESLALVAADWSRWAATSAKHGGAKSRRTELLYAMRSAAKTSPLSGLTTVRVAGSRGAGRATSRVSCQDAVGVLYGLAASSETASSLRYRAAESVLSGPAADASLMMVSLPAFRNGLVYRDDQVVRSSSVLRWLDALGIDELGYDEVTRALGGTRPRTRFTRLLEAGVLRPVRPWAPGEDPFVAMSELPHLPAEIAGRLRQVSRSGEAIAEEGVRERLALIDGVAKLLDGQFADMARPSPAGSIYEDRETPAHLSPEESCLTEEVLGSLASTIRPHLFRSHAYDLLVERLVAEVGVGGTCNDPLTFFMRMCVDEDGDSGLLAAQMLDLRMRDDPGERAWLPVSPTSAAPHVGVYLQSWAARDPHDATLVVNQLGTGTGSLFARFHGLLGTELADAIREHIAGLWSASTCYELRVWTDVNTVQSACSGLLPALQLPGEPIEPDGLSLQDCKLVHDPVLDTVALLGTDGEPVGIAYLGLLPSFQLPSLARWLTILSDPWVNLFAPCDKQSPFAGPPRFADGQQVVHEPRQFSGQVVTRRASWTLRRASVPPTDGTDEVGLLLAFDAIRAAHAIPEEVYAFQATTGATRGGDTRKPLWVNLSSVDAIRMLGSWISPDATHLRLVEALPTRSQYQVRDDQGRKFVSEEVALLRWSR
ncbi:MAG: hypothetical protein ACOH10_14770 [Rhodoglobus sp.]